MARLFSSASLHSSTLNSVYAVHAVLPAQGLRLQPLAAFQALWHASFPLLPLTFKRAFAMHAAMLAYTLWPQLLAI